VGNSSCNSDHGNAVASSCIFYDVTSVDMDVDCVGPNCFLADGSVGVLSTSNSSFLPAYDTGVGWDFATGIGTINAANLVNNWPVAAPQPNFTLSASPASLAVVQGSSGFSSISVAPQNGFAGNVTFSATGLPSGVTASFTSNPDPTSTTLTLSAGATAAIGMFAVTVIGTSGNITSQTTISLTVNPAGNYTLSAVPSTVSITQGTSGASTITINKSAEWLRQQRQPDGVGPAERRHWVLQPNQHHRDEHFDAHGKSDGGDRDFHGDHHRYVGQFDLLDRYFPDRKCSAKLYAFGFANHFEHRARNSRQRYGYYHSIERFHRQCRAFRFRFAEGCNCLVQPEPCGGLKHVDA